MNVGVLALQGGFELHQQALAASGFSTVLIRKPDQLNGVDALVIPGGESSALLKLMAPWDFLSAIQAFAEKQKVVGTCAGAILMAKEVLPAQSSLSLIEMSVRRNAYGRQIESFIGAADEHKTKLVFIRAPEITSAGSAVQVKLHCDGKPVCVQQGNAMAMTFHPEMADYQDVVDFLNS